MGNRLSNGCETFIESPKVYVDSHTYTWAKIPSETSFTLLQFCCTRRCRRGIERLMSTRYSVCSCTGVISILIESRFAVSNAECPSRHEKLPYFRIDSVTIPRYTTSYGNDTFKTFCYAGLIEGTYLHIFVYARNEKKNINKLGKYIFWHTWEISLSEKI